MATQIAATPIVKGNAAVKIYKEANKKPTKASKRGAQMLMKKYEGKLK